MPRLKQRSTIWAQEEILSPPPKKTYDLIHEFSRHRLSAQNLSVKTVRIGERYLIGWGAHLASLGADVLTATDDHALSFIESWERFGWSASHRGHILSTLRAFHTWLVIRKLAPTNPWTFMHAPKSRKRLPRYVMPLEFERLAQQFCRPCWRDVRDRAVIEFIWSTGCRVGGVCALNLTDLDLTHQKAIVCEKGNKERVVYLTKRGMKYLRIYLDEVRPVIAKTDQAVFVGQQGKRIVSETVRESLRRASSWANLGRTVTPHQLRHGFATSMRRNGADLREIQELLGHERISTTEIYTHIEQEEVEQAHRKFHPHGKQAS